MRAGGAGDETATPRAHRTPAAGWVLFGLLVVLSAWQVLGQQGTLSVLVAFPLTSATSIATLCIVGAIFWWLFAKVPYFGPVGRASRWLALVWGALVALQISIPLEGSVIALFDSTDQTTHAAILAMVAGPVEESVKALGVLVVFLLVRRPRTLVDGAVIGATVGLGFELFEDFGYTSVFGLTAGYDGVSGILSGLAMRVATAPVSHWLFTGIFGVGLAYVFCARWAGPTRRALVLVGCGLLAMALHTGWDLPGLGSTAEEVALTTWGQKALVGVVALVAAVRFVRWSRNREGEFFVTYLVRDGSSGLPASQLHALPHGLTRREARKQAAAGSSDRRSIHHAVRAVHRAAASLADALADANAETGTARSELADRLDTATKAGAHLSSPGAQR